MVGALGGLLFGFDTAVISGATDALTRIFQLSAGQLGFTVAIALAGTVVGSVTAGPLEARYGGRAMLRVMAVLYLFSAIGCAIATSWTFFLTARLIGGIGVGGSSVLGPVYIAEIAPARLRGRLVGLFQINIVIGVLLAYLSNYLIARGGLGAVEWRWDFGVAAFPAALFLVLLFTIPRSARWLVARGQIDEGYAVLGMIGSNPDVEMQEIAAAINEESINHKEDLFQRKYRRPILLAITIALFNQLSGINAILYYLNDVFAAAGFARMSGNLQAVAVGCMDLIATLIAMQLIDKIGRKTLLLIGSVGMALSLAAVATVFAGNHHRNWLLPCLVTYIFFFAISQGSVIWVYLSEIFPTQVRGKGQGLGCTCHWVMNALISATFPLIAQHSRAVPFGFFAAMMVIQFVLVQRYFPETMNVSLEDLQRQLAVEPGTERSHISESKLTR